MTRRLSSADSEGLSKGDAPASESITALTTDPSVDSVDGHLARQLRSCPDSQSPDLLPDTTLILLATSVAPASRLDDPRPLGVDGHIDTSIKPTPFLRPLSVDFLDAIPLVPQTRDPLTAYGGDYENTISTRSPAHGVPLENMINRGTSDACPSASPRALLQGSPISPAAFLTPAFPDLNLRLQEALEPHDFSNVAFQALTDYRLPGDTEDSQRVVASWFTPSVRQALAVNVIKTRNGGGGDKSNDEPDGSDEAEEDPEDKDKGKGKRLASLFASIARGGPRGRGPEQGQGQGQASRSPCTFGPGSTSKDQEGDTPSCSHRRCCLCRTICPQRP